MKLNIGEKRGLSVIELMLQPFVNAVIASGPPQQVINRGADGVPYIERWMLARKAVVPQPGYNLSDNWLAEMMTPGECGLPLLQPSFIGNLYIHRYGRADPEDLHDHPWDNVSLVVAGSYVEQLEDGSRRMLVEGDIVVRNAEEKHSIIDVVPGTITLFATLPKTRDWGFWQDGKFVPAHEYQPTTGKLDGV